MSARFERDAAVVTVLTALSRVAGLARDAVMSRVFGAGAVADAFFFAFLVPNLFRRLFGEGALSAAFLPVYARLDREDPAVARRLATLLAGRLVVVLGAIALLAELVLVPAAALAEGERALGLRLAAIMAPYMPMVCLVAVLGAMLQVHGRFGPTAAAPVLLNAAIIAGALGSALVVAPDDAAARVTVVAAAVLVAGVAQVAWSLHALRGHVRRDASREGTAEPWRAVLHQAMPMIVGLGVLQLNTFLDGLIASWPTMVGPTILGRPYPLDEGAMAAISFAQRLYQFPLGVFGIAVATAIFPSLARLAGEPSAFAAVLRRGLRLVVFIGIPASIGLVLVRDELTIVVLRGGDFTAEHAQRVARVLLGYAPAIWAYSMTHVLARGFYARGDSRTPLKVALGIVGLNVALNWALIWTPLREAGLAWSTAICAVVQAALLARLLARRTDRLVDRAVVAGWLRTIAAALGMTGAVLLAGRVLPDADGWWPALGRLLGLVAAGAGAFAAGALVLRMPELPWTLGRSPRAPDA